MTVERDSIRLQTGGYPVARHVSERREMSEPQDENCKKCGGHGLLKHLFDSWRVIECDRCGGFGVDPDAKPAHGQSAEG